MATPTSGDRIWKLSCKIMIKTTVQKWIHLKVGLRIFSGSVYYFIFSYNWPSNTYCQWCYLCNLRSFTIVEPIPRSNKRRCPLSVHTNIWMEWIHISTSDRKQTRVSSPSVNYAQFFLFSCLPKKKKRNTHKKKISTFSQHHWSIVQILKLNLVKSLKIIEMMIVWGHTRLKLSIDR